MNGLIVAPDFAADVQRLGDLPPKVRRSVRKYAGEAPGKFLVFMETTAPPMIGDDVDQVGHFLAWVAKHRPECRYDVWNVYSSHADSHAMIESAAMYWGRG